MQLAWIHATTAAIQEKAEMHVFGLILKIIGYALAAFLVGYIVFTLAGVL